MHQNLKQYSVGMERIELFVMSMLRNFKRKLENTKEMPYSPKTDIYNFTVQSLLYFLLGKFIDEDSDIFKKKSGNGACLYKGGFHDWTRH